MHPDHVQSAALVESARFYSKFVKGDLPHEPWYPRKHLHYFSTHIRVRFNPSVIFDISGFLECKMASIRAYESQFVVHAGNAARLQSIEHEARYWGDQVGIKAGEPFVCKELLKVKESSALFDL